MKWSWQDRPTGTWPTEDSRAKSKKDKEGMANMQNLGENMAFLLKAIEKAKENN